MLPNKELVKGGAHAALLLNATATDFEPAAKREACMRCGRVRAVHSTIVVRCAEGRTVEAGICGACTRRMSR